MKLYIFISKYLYISEFKNRKKIGSKLEQECDKTFRLISGTLYIRL